MKYTIINENGIPTAFYDDAIHSSIPSGAIEITDAQWMECINNNGKRKFENGEVVEYVYIPTPDEIFEKISNAIQRLLDAKAKERRYTDMLSARGYTGFANPFQAECITLAVWAANCWAVAGQIEADVKSGARSIPTVEEVLAELPTL